MIAAGFRDYLKQQDKEKGSVSVYLQNYMRQVSNYNGLSGTITIDNDGAARSIHADLYQIRNGELVKMVD